MELSFSVEGRTAHAGLLRAFLHAIQQSASIRFVSLDYSSLPTDISTFVDTASSITKFSLNGCDMDPAAERQQGAQRLALALQRNTNIETLELHWLEDIYAVPILEGLRLNTAVKTFIFYPPSIRFLDETSLAIQQLLESTSSVQRFELTVDSDDDEVLNEPIAQAIINNESVSELKFTYVHFHFQGRDSLAQLQRILQDKRNLTSLCLHGCYVEGGQVQENIISILSRPESSLRCFEFQSRGSPWEHMEDVFSRIHFKNLLEAVQTSKLERFEIGSIETLQQLQTLVQCIPLMPIRELDVAFERQILRENSIPIHNVLLAIKNNFSLRSVKFFRADDDRPFLLDTAEDNQRLAFYASRNERLDQWVDNPETVKDRKVWPEALNLVQKAGPTALFRGIRSVLERDYVSLPGGRKSKRPQHDASS